MNHYDLLIYRSTHQSLFVKDQSFSFTQLVAATYKIKWRGKNAPTFSTSDTLPTGITLSSNGIVSYDGSINQTGVTNWTVTATDGVDTVTASMTTTMNSATISIADGQTLSFQIGVASSMQIQYTADGTPTFAVTSGTLPSGVTMTTGGLLVYDGTGSTDVSTSVEVTATLATSASDTATIGVKLASIPQDFMFYAPLSSDYNDQSTYSRSMSYYGNQPTFSQIKGVPCATFDGSSGIYTYDATDVNTGEHDRTISGWIKLTNPTQTWPTLLFYGYPSSKSDLHVTIYSGGIQGCSWGVDTTPRFPADYDWHHYLIRYTASTHTLEFFTDNTLISSTVVSGGVNFPSSNIGMSVCCTPNGNDKANRSSYAGVRFYDRALSNSEIASLASEFTPVEDIVFNDQSAKFITETSATKQLVTDPTGCTFSTSDTLPTGVTLASDGTLSFDGSVISQDSTTAISVTASKTGYANATATITLTMYATQPSVPEEEYLVIDAELATSTTPTVGTFVSKGSNWSFTSIDSVDATYCDGTGQNGIWYTPARNIGGNTPRTFSVWCYPLGYPHDGNALYGHGNTNMDNIVQYEGNSQGRIHFPWGENWEGSLLQVARPTENGWTQVVLTYDGNYVRLYYNGVLVGTSNNASNINTTNTNVVLGNRIDNTSRCWYGYLRNLKAWDVALTGLEVSNLYDAELPTFDPVPVVPTDYHERWALQSDRNSTKHPSDTTYTLNRSTNASVSYGASGGMTGATVSSGCLYNTNSISGTVTNGYCLSIWCKCSSTPTSSTNIKCFANPANSTQYGLWLGYRQNKYAVGCDMTTLSLRSVSDVSVDTSWHNLVANYDKTNLKVDLWIDGVKATTFSLSSAISKAAGIVVNAGNVTDVTAPDYMPDVSVKYAYVTTFTRTLSDAEVQGLYHEFD